MKIIAVDDKEMPRKVLVRAITESEPNAEIAVCSNAAEVLALPHLDSFHVAFVDIAMPGINGIELARKLKHINPRINIVFATGYDEYMADAFLLHSSGYLMKPVTTADVTNELNNLRFPPNNTYDANKLVVRCFGNFEVFVNGRAVAFERAKSKELLAYLVDRRGAIVSLREAQVALWDEKSTRSNTSNSYLRTLVSDLRRTLESCGHPNVLIKRYGSIGIDMTKVACDYYDYLKGKPLAINAWRGEYMNQYPWSEATRKSLLQ